MNKNIPPIFQYPKCGKYVFAHHAKMLKELGFDWPTKAHYYPDADGKLTFMILHSPENHNSIVYDGLDCYSAPNIYAAAKWLREKGIYVEVKMRTPCKFEVVGKIFVAEACPQIKYLFDMWDVEAGIVFPSYEVALLYGIGFALRSLMKSKEQTI